MEIKFSFSYIIIYSIYLYYKVHINLLNITKKKKMTNYNYLECILYKISFSILI